MAISVDEQGRFRLMVEGSEQVFFFSHDLEGRWSYLSPSIEKVLGYTPAELLGTAYSEIIATGTERDEIDRRTRATLEGKDPSSTYSATVLHKDGRPVVLEVVESSTRRDGGILGVHGFARDISDRALAEAELQVQKTHLEHLFESAPEAVALLDEEHRVIRVNREFARLFGFTSDEVAGLVLDELIVPDRERAEARRITEAAKAGPLVHAECVRRRKDGSELQLRVLATPIRLGTSPTAVYTTFRDVTDQRRATDSLAAAEAHYRRLVESSPYAIFVVDAEGRITELNRAAGELLGEDPASLLGREFADLLAPEERERALDEFREQLDGQVEVRDTEVHIVRSDGELRLIEARSTPIRSGERVIGLHGVARDITEERAREVQLRRAERLSSLATLLSGVAHELNNPLTSIKSFSQLMLLDPRSADDRESLGVIHREADRAAKIVADLRLITRQTYGDDAHRSLHDLNEVVRSVVSLARFSIESDQIEIREDLARDPLPVYGHRGQLEQMVLNLVMNAEQAVREAREERRIIVRTRQSGLGYALAVIDSGPGISPEHLDRIFDPFWTTRTPGEGIGLGLSVVHSIVNDHGGEVRVESEIGRGSAFTVDLPWSTPGISPIIPARIEREVTEPLRILIVDDEAPIRQSLARFLERRGHFVSDAEDGRRALQCLETDEPYDLVVSDLRMPGLCGEQLFRHLENRGDGSERRVVFITGDAANANAERFLQGAGVPVLLKPFALAEVAETLECHAARLADGQVPRETSALTS
jgi:PAS domain S-box-containing protein